MCSMIKSLSRFTRMHDRQRVLFNGMKPFQCGVRYTWKSWFWVEFKFKLPRKWRRSDAKHRVHLLRQRSLARSFRVHKGCWPCISGHRWSPAPILQFHVGDLASRAPKVVDDTAWADMSNRFAWSSFDSSHYRNEGY